MRLLMMADGEVGSRSLDWLIQAHPEDLAVVVAASENELAKRARGAGCATFVGTDSAEIASFCGEVGDLDLGVLAWWPKLVKPPLIGLPAQGFINFHPSLLPFNRGKHYNFWALVERAPFGVSLHFIDSGVDSGDVVAQRRLSYDWTDTGGTLHRRACDAMFELFRDTYPALRSGDIPRTAQDLSAGSFHRASEIEAASRIELDRSYPARELLDRLRARTFPGYPACRFEDGGETYEVRVEITKVENERT